MQDPYKVCTDYRVLTTYKQGSTEVALRRNCWESKVVRDKLCKHARNHTRFINNFQSNIQCTLGLRITAHTHEASADGSVGALPLCCRPSYVQVLSSVDLSVFIPNTPSCEEMTASAPIFKHNHLANGVKVAERDRGPQSRSTRAPLSPRVSTSTKVAAVPAHLTFVKL